MNSEAVSAPFLKFMISDKGAPSGTAATHGPDRILFCQTYGGLRIIGSFFSCVYEGALRVHLVFNEEPELYDESIFELLSESFRACGMRQGQIWFCSKSKKLIALVGERFRLEPDPEPFFYHSTEYVTRRGRFHKRFDGSLLTVRPYEEEHLERYLELLNDAMSFFIPPEDFVSQKERYAREFADLKEKKAFEAFWTGNALVGLYWLDGTEVDTIGVSSGFQRQGYGSMILTRAIETVFQQNPAAEYAILYAVGWNAKAQRFYQKYGMEVRKRHKVPYS